MNGQFKRHYTVEEARRLIPQLRNWLSRMRELVQRMETVERRLSGLAGEGDDRGGGLVDERIRILADLAGLQAEFDKREIYIKDLQRGLVDFPAIRHGREVFLCWEMDEADIQFWHELHTGYAGRESLSESGLD